MLLANDRNKNKRSTPNDLHPNDFSKQLIHPVFYSLFLDIDGTLAEFTLNPKDSVIAPTTLAILEKIQALGVPIAAVTGRSLQEAQQMLYPLRMPIAATHGLEISLDGIHCDNSHKAIEPNLEELSTIKQALTHSCAAHAELMIEHKPYSVALHYRCNPKLNVIAHQIMTTLVLKHPNWQLKQGKFVWEIVPKNVNKGSAILTLLKLIPCNKPICPIFIGDDITDEAGFEAVQSGYAASKELSYENSDVAHLNLTDQTVGNLKGLGIKVGDGATAAHYRVHNVSEVADLLNSFLNFCQQQKIYLNDKNKQKTCTLKTIDKKNSYKNTIDKKVAMRNTR